MKPAYLAWKISLSSLFAVSCLAGLLFAYEFGPPAAHTGDFSEPTCTECHTSFPLNATGGTLTVTGVPAQYQPGQTYPITVTIAKSGQRKWGFELSVRVISTKQQAGTLVVINGDTQIQTQAGIQYIEQTQTSYSNSKSTWTFNWVAPATAVGDVRFSCAGNAANGDLTQLGDFIYTTTATSSAASATPNLVTYFAHAAIGGGYTTSITLLNTGTTSLTGKLILTGQDGTPLTAIFTGSAGVQTTGSSVDLNIQSGGIQIWTAAPVGSSDPTKAGWARVESTGGSLSGVATFQYAPGGSLATIAGVLSSDTVLSATIPIDDDFPNRTTGYAVANPSTTTSITVNIQTVKSDGTPAVTLTPITLGPGGQTATFIWQDPNVGANFKFKGSAVLTEQSGKKFSVVALVQNQGLFTAIPVLSSSSAGASGQPTYFAHLALGAGWTTSFTLLNTGTSVLTGKLFLTENNGNPLTAQFTDSSGAQTAASSVDVNIPAGGSQVWSANAVNPNEAAPRTGWARVESSGGNIGGVATFQYAPGGGLATIAGVLSGDTVLAATIPVDDVYPSRTTGYAVANPSTTDTITITIRTYKTDGTPAATLAPITLPPGAQTATFIWQDPNVGANFNFKGSAVLTEQSGKRFSVVALVQNQNLYTAIPVIPQKAF
jgi:hypothetical protein